MKGFFFLCIFLVLGAERTLCLDPDSNSISTKSIELLSSVKVVVDDLFTDVSTTAKSLILSVVELTPISPEDGLVETAAQPGLLTQAVTTVETQLTEILSDVQNLLEYAAGSPSEQILLQIVESLESLLEDVEYSNRAASRAGNTANIIVNSLTGYDLTISKYYSYKGGSETDYITEVVENIIADVTARVNDILKSVTSDISLLDKAVGIVDILLSDVVALMDELAVEIASTDKLDDSVFDILNGLFTKMTATVDSLDTYVTGTDTVIADTNEDVDELLNDFRSEVIGLLDSYVLSSVE